jgi:hypothetical protein
MVGGEDMNDWGWGFGVVNVPGDQRESIDLRVSTV